MVGEQLYTIYSKLKEIAEKEFEDIVNTTDFIGGKASVPNKLRIFFIDNSFLDVWLEGWGLFISLGTQGTKRLDTSLG